MLQSCAAFRVSQALPNIQWDQGGKGSRVTPVTHPSGRNRFAVLSERCEEHVQDGVVDGGFKEVGVGHPKARREGTPRSVQDVCVSTFDLTRGNSDVSETGDPQTVQGDESTTETEADTVCYQGEQQNSNQRRRLRLVWNKPPHRQVRAAQVMFEELSRRVGPVPVGAPVPRIVREHRWSVLNVPLMWDATGQERSTPTLDWFCHVSTEFPAPSNGGSLPVSEATRTGWLSLRTPMRAWGIAQQDDLSTLSTRICVVGRVSTRCPRGDVGSRVHHNHVGNMQENGASDSPRAPPTHPTMHASWAELDEVDLEGFAR